jgi:hypothetical protein
LGVSISFFHLFICPPLKETPVEAAKEAPIS